MSNPFANDPFENDPYRDNLFLNPGASRAEAQPEPAPESGGFKLGGLGDALAGIPRGAEGLVQDIYGLADMATFDALPDWKDEDRVFGTSDTLVGGLVEGITQFMIPFGLLGKAGKLGKLGRVGEFLGKNTIASGLAKGAIVDFAAFDGHSGRVADLSKQVLGDNFYSELMGTEADDSELEGRLKNALEGAAIGGTIDLLLSGMRVHKAYKTLRDQGATAEEAATKSLGLFEDAIDARLSKRIHEDARKRQVELGLAAEVDEPLGHRESLNTVLSKTGAIRGLSEADREAFVDFTRRVGKNLFDETGLVLNEGVAGRASYDYRLRTISLFSDAFTEGTIRQDLFHEIWHSVEDTLTKRESEAIVKQFVDERNARFAENAATRDRFTRFNSTQDGAQKSAILDEIVAADEYRYISPAEWFASNATLAGEARMERLAKIKDGGVRGLMERMSLAFSDFLSLMRSKFGQAKLDDIVAGYMNGRKAMAMRTTSRLAMGNSKAYVRGLQLSEESVKELGSAIEERMAKGLRDLELAAGLPLDPRILSASAGEAKTVAILHSKRPDGTVRRIRQAYDGKYRNIVDALLAAHTKDGVLDTSSKAYSYLKAIGIDADNIGEAYQQLSKMMREAPETGIGVPTSVGEASVGDAIELGLSAEGAITRFEGVGAGILRDLEAQNLPAAEKAYQYLLVYTGADASMDQAMSKVRPILEGATADERKQFAELVANAQEAKILPKGGARGAGPGRGQKRGTAARLPDVALPEADIYNLVLSKLKWLDKPQSTSTLLPRARGRTTVKSSSLGAEQQLAALQEELASLNLRAADETLAPSEIAAETVRIRSLYPKAVKLLEEQAGAVAKEAAGEAPKAADAAAEAAEAAQRARAFEKIPPSQEQEMLEFLDQIHSMAVRMAKKGDSKGAREFIENARKEFEQTYNIPHAAGGDDSAAWLVRTMDETKEAVAARAEAFPTKVSAEDVQAPREAAPEAPLETPVTEARVSALEEKAASENPVVAEAAQAELDKINTQLEVKAPETPASAIPEATEAPVSSVEAGGIEQTAPSGAPVLRTEMRLYNVAAQQGRFIGRTRIQFESDLDALAWDIASSKQSGKRLKPASQSAAAELEMLGWDLDALEAHGEKVYEAVRAEAKAANKANKADAVFAASPYPADKRGKVAKTISPIKPKAEEVQPTAAAPETPAAAPEAPAAAVEAPAAAKPAPKPKPEPKPRTLADLVKAQGKLADEDIETLVAAVKRRDEQELSSIKVDPRDLTDEDLIARVLQKRGLNLVAGQQSSIITDEAVRIARAIEEAASTKFEMNKAVSESNLLKELDQSSVEAFAASHGISQHQALVDLAATAKTLGEIRVRLTNHRIELAVGYNELSADLAKLSDALDAAGGSFEALDDMAIVKVMANANLLVQRAGLTADAMSRAGQLLRSFGDGAGSRKAKGVVDATTTEAAAIGDAAVIAAQTGEGAAEVVKKLGGKEKAILWAEKVKVIIEQKQGTSIQRMNQVLRLTADARKVGFWDMHNEFWINAILSHPSTMLTVQAMSNALTTAMLPIQRGLGGQVGEAVMLTKNLAKSVVESLTVAKQAFVEQRPIGVRGRYDGQRAFALTSETIPIANKFAAGSGVRSTVDGAATVWRTPMRVIQSTDEFFKQMIFRAHMRTALESRLSAKGLAGAELAQEIENGMSIALVNNEFVNHNALLRQGMEESRKLNPTAPVEQHIKYAQKYRDDHWEAASKVLADFQDHTDRATFIAKDTTLQADPRTSNSFGRLQQKIQQTVRDIPAMRLVLPFVSTPLNALVYTADLVSAPLHLAVWHAKGRDRALALAQKMGAPGKTIDWLQESSGRFAQEISSADKSVRADAIGRAWAATGLMLSAWALARNGKITGRGPQNKDERRTWERAGNQAYSVKVGDQWIQYNRLEPISSVFSSISDFVLAMEYAGDDETLSDEVSTVATSLWFSLVNNLTNKSYMKGLSDALEILTTDDPNKMEQWLKRHSSSYIPAAGGAVVEQVDPVLRSNDAMMLDGWQQLMFNRIPGLSSESIPMRDAFGDVMMRSERLGPDPLSPLRTKKASQDPVDLEFAKLRKAFNAPSKTQRGLDLSQIRLRNGRNAYDLFQEEVSKTKIGGKSLRDSMRELVTSREYLNASAVSTDQIESPRVLMIRGLFMRYRQRAWQQFSTKNSEIQQLLMQLDQQRRNAGLGIAPSVLSND